MNLGMLIRVSFPPPEVFPLERGRRPAFAALGLVSLPAAEPEPAAAAVRTSEVLVLEAPVAEAPASACAVPPPSVVRPVWVLALLARGSAALQPLEPERAAASLQPSELLAKACALRLWELLSGLL